MRYHQVTGEPNALSGQTLGSYLQQKVYGPLGMNDSTFAPSNIDLPPTSEWDAAGHGSYGTVQDYGRFVQAWLNDGAGILGTSTVEMALQSHLGHIRLPELIKSTVPELSNDVPALPVPQSWGLGFHLTLDMPVIETLMGFELAVYQQVARDFLWIAIK